MATLLNAKFYRGVSNRLIQIINPCTSLLNYFKYLVFPFLYPLFILWAIIFCTTSVYGQTEQANQKDLKIAEYRIKAALLYKFTLFIKWPLSGGGEKESKAYLDITILGDDPFGSLIDATFRGKTVNNQTFRIKRINRLDDLDRCDILFISASEKANWKAIFEKIAGWNVLTVGDYDDFARMGGVINFIQVNNTIRFEINIDAEHRSGLDISSQLLKLAVIVHDAT